MLLTVGDILRLHWTATARLKLGSRRTEKKQKIPALKLGTWNVRTTIPGLSEDLQEVCDARKTALINNELRRLRMDIVTLQQTRLSSSGMLSEKDFTFYWHGKSPDERREEQSARLHHSTRGWNQKDPEIPTSNFTDRTGQPDQRLRTYTDLPIRRKGQVLR